MDEVYTLGVGRYWSEVLCCTITTHLGDFEVKVMDFRVKVFGLSFYKSISPEYIDRFS